MPYATEAELENLTGVTLDAARATLLLQVASHAIDEYVGFPVGSAAATETYDGPGGTFLMLPRWPVTAVTTVKVTDTAGTETTLAAADFRWSARGWLTRVGGTWPTHERSIEVTYTAGHATDSAVYGAVKGICLTAAARAAENPRGKKSESIGDWSATYGDVTVTFDVDNQRTLDRIRTIHAA